MKKLVLAVVLVAAALTFVLASTALADDDNGGTFRAKLNGYHEVTGPPTGSVSTIADGRFEIRVRNGVAEYRLTYSNLEGGAATQAHIHFAEEHVGGGVIAFLCGGGTKPDPCPLVSGTVTGFITPADVIGPTGQGIEPGSFTEFVRAMRAGATYANVHSTRWPQGEIRGQINGRGDGRGDNDDDD
jgi:hypothetical protein